MSIRILALDGSLRAGSYNRQLAEAAIGYSRRDCSEGASLRTAPEIRWWFHAVDATVGGFDSSSLSFSAGVFQSSVWRGRLLSRVATWSR